MLKQVYKMQNVAYTLILLRIFIKQYKLKRRSQIVNCQAFARNNSIFFSTHKLGWIRHIGWKERSTEDRRFRISAKSYNTPIQLKVALKSAVHLT